MMIVSSESFATKWKDGKAIFIIILIINVSVILAAAFLPATGIEHFQFDGVVDCPDTDSAGDGNPEDSKCNLIQKNPAVFVALGVITVVNLVGFLAFFNRMSTSPDLTKGEMRKTFSITIIMIYLLVLSLTITGHIHWDADKKLFENFTYVVITVIIFYFGSRTYKQARELANNSNNSNSSGNNSAGSDAETKVKDAKDVEDAEAEDAEAEVEVKKTETQVLETKLEKENAPDEMTKKTAEVKLLSATEAHKKAIERKSESSKKLTAAKNKSMNPEVRKIKAQQESSVLELKNSLLRKQLDAKTASATTNPVSDIIEEIAQEFKTYMDENPGASGQSVNDFQKKFTKRIGELIAEGTTDIAVRQTDQADLNNRLNAIFKKTVPNLRTSKTVSGIDLGKKTAREIAQLIDDGVIPPMHLGPITYEVLKQEVESLRNSYAPTTMTDDEKQEFSDILIKRVQEIKSLPDGTQRDELLDLVDKIRRL